MECDVNNSPYQEGSFSDKVHKYISSTTIEELEQNLQPVFSNLYELIPWFEGLLEELFIHTIKKFKLLSRRPLDTSGIEYSVLYQMWDKIGFYLMMNYQNLQLPPYLINSFYRKFLQAFLTIQRPSSTRWIRLHKGGIYHNLGISLLFFGEKEQAKSYFLLGMIEDLLSQQSLDDDNFKSAPGYSNLKSLNTFENEEEELGNIRRIARKSRLSSSPFGLNNPELIFLEFMTQPKSIIKASQFLLWDNVFFKLFLKETSSTTSTTELGHFLEMLSAYLFFTIGKFEVSCNVKTLHAEHDLRIRNLITNDPIMELLGRYLLVECKNWGKKINSTLVKKFITNVRFARCDTGIMISKKEATGSRSKDSAWYVIRAEYHKDGVVIILLTLKDLNKIADEKVNFLELLKEKYETIRFDGR